MGVAEKVKEALASEETLVLTDVQGNEILNSEGTRGSIYWKQNSRKVFAVLESYFHEFTHSNKRRRISHKEDADIQGLQDAIERIDEVVLTAQDLKGVASSIKELAQLANTKTTVLMTESQATQIKDAFTCLVCKGL
ncbi:UNVERIFIED_CONTAM: hypothetical protein FKN15_034738 [Acipenser sinensis]